LGTVAIQRSNNRDARILGGKPTRSRVGDAWAPSDECDGVSLGRGKFKQFGSQRSAVEADSPHWEAPKAAGGNGQRDAIAKDEVHASEVIAITCVPCCNSDAERIREGYQASAARLRCEKFAHQVEGVFEGPRS
jgi:hypothetical protein